MSQALNDEGSQAVLEFLKRNVPKTDIPNLSTELNKDFVLAKRRSKEQKKKPSRKKTRTLTRKDKKKLGFYEIPRNGIKYSDVVPMYEIWSEYMNDLLELNKTVPESPGKVWEQFTLTVYKADFHGSMLKVIRSKCPSYVDKSGICIMDTRNTFKIVSKNNVVTTIPKKECVFEVFLKNFKLTIFGKLLSSRPADRSTKKIRCQILPDLG